MLGIRKTIVFDIGLWSLSEEPNIRKALSKLGWAYCFSNISIKYPYPNDDPTKKFLQIHCYVDESIKYMDLGPFWEEYNRIKEGDKELTLIEMVQKLKDQTKINAIYDLLVMNATQL